MIGSSRPSFIVVLAAICCVLGLLLPTVGDMESTLPTYVHLSLPQKLVAAYVLGKQRHVFRLKCMHPLEKCKLQI